MGVNSDGRRRDAMIKLAPVLLAASSLLVSVAYGKGKHNFVLL